MSRAGRKSSSCTCMFSTMLPTHVISVRLETFASGDMTSSSASLKHSSKSPSSDERILTPIPTPPAHRAAHPVFRFAAFDHHRDVIFAYHLNARFVEARHRASKYYILPRASVRVHLREIELIQTRAKSSTPKPWSCSLASTRVETFLHNSRRRRDKLAKSASYNSRNENEEKTT